MSSMRYVGWDKYRMNMRRLWHMYTTRFQIHSTGKNASDALNSAMVVYICNPSFGRRTQISLCEFRVQAPSQPGRRVRVCPNNQTDRKQQLGVLWIYTV